MNQWNPDLSSGHILLRLGWSREVIRNSVRTYTHIHIYVIVSTTFQIKIDVP